MGLDVDCWLDGSRVVIEVCGELDAYSAPMLREALERLPRSPGSLRIAVLMERVSFMDSAGIGVLIGALKRTQATGGRVSLVGCSAHIGSMVRTMGLNRVFGLHVGLDEALTWLDQTRS